MKKERAAAAKKEKAQAKRRAAQAQRSTQRAAAQQAAMEKSLLPGNFSLVALLKYTGCLVLKIVRYESIEKAKSNVYIEN